MISNKMKFLITESFSWENVCLHSKSKGYSPTVKFFRFKIVTIQKYFKLFRIWKALKLRQSIIEFILQNFLLIRIIPTHKEMCNCFFLPTFTAICITVADFKAISIQIAAANPQPAHQTVDILISIFVMAIFRWFLLYLMIFYEAEVILVITKFLRKIIPRPAEVWEEQS